MPAERRRIPLLAVGLAPFLARILVLAAVLAAAGLLALMPGAALADEDAGLPNVFISPPGKPFRAAPGAAYPVVDWFKQADANGDGRIDRAEFVADAEAFFKVLDANGDGVLDTYEVSFYEHRIAPEILGVRLAGADGARLWRAQYGGEFPMPGAGVGPSMGPEPGSARPNEPTRPKQQDRFGQGAAPFSFLGAPEPVTSSDPDFMFRGRVLKANFMSRADRNFTELDAAGAGFLTLAGLPRTPVQALIEEARRKDGSRRR